MQNKLTRETKIGLTSIITTLWMGVAGVVVLTPASMQKSCGPQDCSAAIRACDAKGGIATEIPLDGVVHCVIDTDDGMGVEVQYIGCE